MLVSRRNFFLGSLASPLLAAKKKLAAPKKRVDRLSPNLLLILVDGLPAWMVGCYGNQEIRTPNIDRLSQTGTRFLNAFVPAPAPIPGRNAYFTGRVVRDPAAPASANGLDQALPAGGYACQTVGGRTLAESTGAAMQFLDRQTAGKPFSLTVLYSGMEPPYEAIPAEFADLYEGQRFENWAADPPARNAARGKEMFAARMANLRKAAGAASAYDAETGKLMRGLYDRHFFNDTLIVFASTCGSLLGRHGLWGGGDASDPPNMFEEVVNVPLIWSYPARVPPSIMQVGLVSAYDLLPTLCDFLGAQPPAGNLCGRSYALLATGKPFPKKLPWRSAVFGSYRNTEMARVDRYKLVIRDEGKGPGELYDMRMERTEAVNHYGDAEFEDVKTNLTGQLAAWRKTLAG
jgi:arylsulfatase A-like enzyme